MPQSRAIPVKQLGRSYTPALIMQLVTKSDSKLYKGRVANEFLFSDGRIVSIR